jgi:hypothetical protein
MEICYAPQKDVEQHGSNIAMCCTLSILASQNIVQELQTFYS